MTDATHKILASVVLRIREGLAAGERIVAKAGTFLRQGDRINPVEVQATAAEVNRS